MTTLERGDRDGEERATPPDTALRNLKYLLRSPVAMAVLTVTSIAAIALDKVLGPLSLAIPFWIGVPICLRIIRERKRVDADRRKISDIGAG